MRLKLPSGIEVRLVVRYLKRPTVFGTYWDTLVQIIGPGDWEMGVGQAVCSPKDSFCKLLGRKLALQHLFKSRPFTKDDRRALFEFLCRPEKFSGLSKQLKKQIKAHERRRRTTVQAP